MRRFAVRPIPATLITQFASYRDKGGTFSATCRAVVDPEGTQKDIADCDWDIKFCDLATRSTDEFTEPETLGLLHFTNAPSGGDPNSDPYASLLIWLPKEHIERLVLDFKLPSSIQASSSGGEHEEQSNESGWVAKLDYLEFNFGIRARQWEPLRGIYSRVYEAATLDRARKGEYASLLRELLQCIRRYHIQEGTSADDRRNDLGEAVDLLNGIHDEANPFIKYKNDQNALTFYRNKLSKYQQDKDQSGWLWTPRDLRSAMRGGEADPAYWACSIESSADDYLTKPWATCAKLEKLIVDCLVYQYGLEVATGLRLGAQGRYLPTLRLLTHRGLIHSVDKSTSRGLVTGAMVGFVASIAVGIGAGYAVNWWAGIFAWQLLSGVNAIAFELHKKRRQPELSATSESVTEEMIGAYNLLKNRYLSPRVLRERFMRLANQGFDWPHGVLEIIGRAESRNPDNWE